MSFFKKLGQALGIAPKNKTDEINNKHFEMKNSMENNLKSIGFTQEEVDEVLNVITLAEGKIQEQKDLLIGSNINNLYVNETMKHIFAQIKKLQLKMADDVRAKIEEIKVRKGM
ncbi:hypothetical protein IJD44_05605 [bacterium]|nr:hypothetical protein [bacterium]